MIQGGVDQPSVPYPALLLSGLRPASQPSSRESSLLTLACSQGSRSPCLPVECHQHPSPGGMSGWLMHCTQVALKKQKLHVQTWGSRLSCSLWLCDKNLSAHMLGWFYFSQESPERIFWTQDKRIDDLEDLSKRYITDLAVTGLLIPVNRPSGLSFVLGHFKDSLESKWTLQQIFPGENKTSQHLC